MNILQFNVRLAEGGAVDVALDLRQRALQQELASHFVYGYGRDDEESVSHQNYPQVIKHIPRMTTMANTVLPHLFNRDLPGDFNELYRTITRTPGPVALHFHTLHNHWLNPKSVVRFCGEVKNHKPDITLVWVLYDHWSVTEHCAFTNDYEDWKTGCQKCSTLNNCLPVKIDRAYRLVTGRQQLLREMLALGCQPVSPSQHVADTFNSLCDSGCCRVINNDTDMTTEVILVNLPPVHETQDKPKIAVIAHDLRYDGKTNQQLVREMMALGDKIELHTSDKFSPLAIGNVVNHGLETDRRKLMSVLSQMDALILSSRIDNYPLILCEALSTGVLAIVTYSNMAREALQKSGGKIISGEDAL